jgi:hypothetical protein
VVDGDGVALSALAIPTELKIRLALIAVTAIILFAFTLSLPFTKAYLLYDLILPPNFV